MNNTPNFPQAITNDELEGAITAGIISASTGDALRQHVVTMRSQRAFADEENFRFLRSFNDIFVTIAIVLVLWAVASLAREASDSLAAAAVALSSWLLAEYFTRKRRMAFPSIILLMSTVGGVYAAVGLLFNSHSPMTVMIIPGILALVVAAAHWFRFHVPITISAAIAAFIAIFLGIIVYIFNKTSMPSNALAFSVLFSGILTLCLAIAIDMQDRLRQTLKADIAFWLHLLAAPLIVHGTFTLLGVFSKTANYNVSLSVVIIYFIFCCLALVIDRRALLVSSLIYILYAVSSIITHQIGAGNALTPGITALVIGVMLLSLSAAWTPLRKMIISLLPDSITRRVPPTGSSPHPAN